MSFIVANLVEFVFRSQKTHPGAVCHLSECPLDDSKVR